MMPWWLVSPGHHQPCYWLCTIDTFVLSSRMNFSEIYHNDIDIVCLFVSLLSHFWLIHFFPPTPALSTIFRPTSSWMCSITPETANVGSSYNRMRGPGIGCWFSDRSNCSQWSLTLTFTLTSENLSLCTTLLLINDKSLQINIFTSSEMMQHKKSEAFESTLLGLYW